MRTAVSLLYEKHRAKPYLVRVWGTVDPDSGKQRRYSKSFAYRCDALAYRAVQEALTATLGPRDPVTVTLAELIEDFKAARFPGLSHATRSSYDNSFHQACVFLGPPQKVRNIGRREAELFTSSRTRVDGVNKPLASGSRKKHVQNLRGLFAAALAWGYVDTNPFQLMRTERSSPLRVTGVTKGWHHLTYPEFQRFMGEVTSPQQRALFLLMYACGLRFEVVWNLVEID